MAEKIAKLKLWREPEALYFVRASEVWKRTFITKGSECIAVDNKIATVGFVREDGYRYFVDRNGDVSREKRPKSWELTIRERQEFTNPDPIYKLTDILLGSRVRNLRHQISCIIATPPRSKLVFPPGTRLRGWLGVLFSKRTCTHVFDPIIADMQLEWTEAHKAGESSKAAMVKVCCSWDLLRAAMATLPISIMRWVWDVWSKLSTG